MACDTELIRGVSYLHPIFEYEFEGSMLSHLRFMMDKEYFVGHVDSEPTQSLFLTFPL